eukprot:IDg5936t1
MFDTSSSGSGGSASSSSSDDTVLAEALHSSLARWDEQHDWEGILGDVDITRFVPDADSCEEDDAVSNDQSESPRSLHVPVGELRMIEIHGGVETQSTPDTDVHLSTSAEHEPQLLGRGRLPVDVMRVLKGAWSAAGDQIP